MSKRISPPEAERSDKQMELRHLRRDARTALELAVVALAPSELVDKLPGSSAAARPRAPASTRDSSTSWSCTSSRA